MAVSITRGECYDCPQPVELAVEEQWEPTGRKVNCDYTCIQNPIKTSDFTNEILPLCTAMYSPFDRNGSGNMGYLYDLNPKLARIFLKATIRLNPYVGELEYVKSFMAADGND